jgi:hypothetical protein
MRGQTKQLPHVNNNAKLVNIPNILTKKHDKLNYKVNKPKKKYSSTKLKTSNMVVFFKSYAFDKLGSKFRALGRKI